MLNAALVIGLLSSQVSAEDLSYADTVRQRGLGRQGEVWCRQQLAKPETTPRQAAELMAQLLVIATDRAVRSGNADAWQAVDRLADALLNAREYRPEWLLVRLQHALAKRAEGEMGFLAGESQQAATALQQAARKLSDVANEVERLRTGAGLSLDDAAAFADAEQASLARRIDLERARTLRLASECYPKKSADRDDALLRGEQLTRRLVAASLPKALLWQSRIEHLAILRALGRLQTAENLMASWRDAPPPAEGEAAYRAEQAYLLMELGKQAEAERLLALASNDSPDIGLARLRLSMNDWRQKKESDPLASKVREQLDQILRRTKRGQYAPVWLHRAERLARPVLLSGSVKGDVEEPVVPRSASGDVESLVRSAELLYRSRQLRSAVKAYDRAAAVAYRKGARGRAFELGTAAAAIVQEQSRTAEDWRGVSDRYRRVSLAAAQRADAAEVHRASVVAFSKSLKIAQAEGEGPQARDWERYFELLEEHLQSWPSASSAQEVRWWLIDALTARQHWRRLISQVLKVDPEDAKYERAVSLLGEAWDAVLSDQPSSAARKQLDRAIDQLQPVITGSDNRWPRQWTAAQRTAALCLARLQLAYGEPATANSYAEQILQTAIKGKLKPPSNTTGQAEDHWQASAAALLAAVAIRQGELGQATNLIEINSPTSQIDAQPVLRALLPLAEASGSDRRIAGELMIDVLASSTATDTSDWALEFQAAAREATGDAAGAIEAARRRVAQQPASQAAHLRLARLLARQPERESKQESLKLLGKLETGASNQTRQWFQIRLARIELMSDLGDRRSASKLLKITKVMHPKLGGMSEAFERLERKIRAQ